MADVITLSDGTTTYDLISPGALQLLQHLTTPAPDHQITWSGTRRRDGRRPAFSFRDNRPMSLPVLISGTTVPVLHDRVSGINLMLQQATSYFEGNGSSGARVTLSLQPDGATNATVFEVLGGVCSVEDWAQAYYFRTAPQILGALQLICSPYGEEATGILSQTAAVTAITSHTLSAARGEIETPSVVYLQVAQAIASPLVWVARRRRGTPANFLYKLRGETGTYTNHTVTDIVQANVTYSAPALGTASDGAHARWQGGVGAAATLLRRMRWAITGAFTDHYGQFRVRARVRITLGTTTRTFQLTYGTANSPTKTATAVITVSFAGTNWGYLDLGIITWPDATVPADTSVTTLVLELLIGTLVSGDNIDVDHLLLIPVDESYIEFPLSANLASGDIVVINGMAMPESLYVLDTGGSIKTSIVPTTITGNFLRVAPGTQVFYGAAVSTTNDVLADNATLSVLYLPRYHWLRGS